MGHTKKTASDAEIHVKMRAQKVSVPYSGRFSMINEVNRGFMNDVTQHNLFSWKEKGVEKNFKHLPALCGRETRC